MRFDLTKYWYRKSLHPVTFLLLPLSGIFGCVVAARRWFYRKGIFKTQKFTAPVIVVGNITVGGTGKTPFVIWLTNFLQEQGYKPGIVSRGYGGREHNKPYWIRSQSTAAEAGDEAILLAQKTNCPVVVSVNRAAAVNAILLNTHCNIVVTDDGLQHYALDRDMEIVMIDSMRQFGNKRLLPAGPLREKLTRLKAVDFVVTNYSVRGAAHHEVSQYSMHLILSHLVSLTTLEEIVIAEFNPKRIHAVAGIGNPYQFFAALKQLGFDVIEHVFPDHHLYQAHDVEFGDDLPIVMTEKDAVKCMSFANDRFWYVSVIAKMNAKLEHDLLSKLKKLEELQNVEEELSKPVCRRTSHVQHDSIRD